MYLDAAGSKQYDLYFFGSDCNNLPRSALQDAGVWCVSMESVTTADGNAEDVEKFVNGDVLFDGDLSKAFYLACDPVLSDDDYRQQQAAYVATYLNWLDCGDSAGYNEVNGLLYAFRHFLTKLENCYVGSEVIQAYAANYL